MSEEKPSAFVVLYRIAKETRKAQKAYFSDRNQTNLVISKECEKALDDQMKIIEEIANQKGIKL